MPLNNEIIVAKYSTGNSGLYIETVLTPEQINAYPNSNPSGYITGVNLSAYITTDQTGAFYPNSNPNGFITNQNVVYTTGDQIINGNKDFYGDQYIFSGADIIVSGGTFNLDIRPVVNGTGVLLSGEVAQLPETIVYTTNDQSITGLKTFRSGIRIGDASQISPPTIQIYDGANGGYSTFSLDDSLLDIKNLNRTLNYDFTKYLTGTTQTIAVIKDIENYTGFATITNLASTGSTLDTKINNLSGNSILVFGNQTISGIKTFINKLIVNSGIDVYFSGNLNTGVSGSHVGVFISGLWNNTGQTYTGIRYNINLFTGASGLVPNTTNSLFNTAVNNTGVFNINSKGQVLVQQLASSAAYDNTFEIKKGSTSYFAIRDDGATAFGLGGGQACSFGGSIQSAIKNGGIVTANGGFLGFSNSADPANYPNEHTVRLYRGGNFILDLRNATYPTSGHQFRVFNITGTNTGEYGIFGWQNNNFIVGSQQTQSGVLRDLTLTGANININASGQLNIFDPTNIVGNLTVSGNTTITGHLSAATKSFLITHPIDSGKKLQYGSLESPYHGIRLTDRAKIADDSVIVKLPNYISSLVNDEKTNIQLTNINHSKVLFVKEVNVAQNYFVVGTDRGWFDKKEYEFYWSFTAERKDVPQLEVEF